MDHDSVPVDVGPPASHRIADIIDTYAKITHRGFEVMGEQIAHEPSYGSNENGHLAWDVSLLIRAACLLWRVTGDPLHLRQAATWATHIVERTDESLCIKDWRGDSGPVWSAGSRYTASTAKVGAVGGIPVHIQASADSVVLERPSATTAIVKVLRNSNVSWTSPAMSLLPGDPQYLPDVIAAQSASHSVLIRGLPGAVDLTFLKPGRYPMRPQLAAHLVHTGMIARSLIAVAQALGSAEPKTHVTDITPPDLLAHAKAALTAHDNEIRIRSGQAWYITPADFPGRRLKLELPHNHVVDVATSFLILGKNASDSGLKNLGASLAQRFLGEIEQYNAGTLQHPWYYYPVDSDIFHGVHRDEPIAERQVPPVQRAEDSSHATIRARALTEWKAIAPDLVSDEALNRVAYSFRRVFLSKDNGIATLRWLPGDENNAKRRGYANSYSGAWGTLAPWEDSIKRRINSMAYRHPPNAFFGATVLSSAEIYALNIR